MPTYEYVCKECGYRFERFQSMTDEPVRTCPKCGGRVRRLLSGGGGIMFKGSGFYATDYKKSDGACCRTSTPCENPKRCCGR